MARSVNFNGRKILLPGVYSVTKSGLNNQFRDLNYGKVLIIDTGSGAGYGGGSGVIGTLEKDVDSLYHFNDITSFRGFVKGGILWDIAQPLFKPQAGEVGVSEIYLIRAATTTPATMTFAPTNGSFTIQVRDEGLAGNGKLVSTNLTKGYGYKFEASTRVSDAFVIKFYVGSYRGVDANSVLYNGIVEADTVPELLVESDPFKNVDDLNAWMEKDPTFNGLFKKTAFSKSSDGSVTSGDLSKFSGFQLAVGGTESYDSTALDKALEAVRDVDYSFILCDNYADDAMNAMNGKIFAHVKDADTRFDKVMLVGGGNDATKFSGSGNTSEAIAKYYDSDKVVVVHGGVKKKADYVGSGFIEKPSLYTAAVVLGRIAGLPPQVPITFKDLNIDGVVHNLTLQDRRFAIAHGILCVIRDNDFNAFIVEQGINSLQDNETIINSKDETYSIQIKRIESQINKEIIVNAKLDLLGQRNGVNKSTLTAKNVEDWVKGYLQRRTATDTVDNLLLSYSSVVVEEIGDAYNVSYAFVPNQEINKLFFTGFLIE